jgi:hypothetical protein
VIGLHVIGSLALSDIVVAAEILGGRRPAGRDPDRTGRPDVLRPGHHYELGVDAQPALRIAAAFAELARAI